MAINPKSLENLDKGRFKRNTREQQQKIAKMGGEASSRAKAKNKQKALERAEVVDVLTRVFNAPADKTTAERLESLNLPNNLLSKTLYNAVQKAGVNSNMLRVLLELINALSQQQTNVTVNNNPYACLSDETLKKLAEED